MLLVLLVCLGAVAGQSTLPGVCANFAKGEAFLPVRSEPIFRL